MRSKIWNRNMNEIEKIYSTLSVTMSESLNCIKRWCIWWCTKMMSRRYWSGVCGMRVMGNGVCRSSCTRTGRCSSRLLKMQIVLCRITRIHRSWWSLTTKIQSRSRSGHRMEDTIHQLRLEFIAARIDSTQRNSFSLLNLAFKIERLSSISSRIILKMQGLSKQPTITLMCPILRCYILI